MLSRWRVLLVLMAVATGCSQPADERTAAVSGKVTLDGAPVGAGIVLFMTESGQAATAELRPDGGYTLRCRPGRFQVAVTPPPPADPLVAGGGATAHLPPREKPIPRRYHDFGTSGLTIDVKAGANPYDIGLSP